MAGDLASYDALCAAYARSLMAEAAFDANPTAATEKAATQAYIEMVNAACRVDPLAIRSPSISQWVERRCALYRDNGQRGWTVCDLRSSTDQN